MPTVVLSSTLTEYAKNKNRVDIAGKTLFGVLINLIQNYPQLRSKLFDVSGNLTRNMNFYLNEETITAKYWQNIRVDKKDIVSILLSSRNPHNPKEPLLQVLAERPPRNDSPDRLKLVYSAQR